MFRLRSFTNTTANSGTNGGASGSVAPVLKTGQKYSELPVHGQGVVMFKTAVPTSFAILDSNADKTSDDGLVVYFLQDQVYVSRISTAEKYIDHSNYRGITKNNGAFYWFSLDSQNQVFYAGIGEARIENVVYEYRFDMTNKEQKEAQKTFFESLKQIKYADSCRPFNILKFPVKSNKIPMTVKTIHELTMMDVAKQTYMPLEHLSVVSQRLFHTIGGTRFVLDDDDFPEFSKAIEYSIATEGCWCNTRIKEKSTEFNPDKPNILETYLRITMGVNNGDSPGQMLVMEIWPKGGHYSPIHSHANCEAIIRVLHGSINVHLYPYLCGQADEIEPFAVASFNQGDVTWISPTLNQIHKLHNISNENTCITIQCYEYDESDTKHYDYFDYIDDDGKIQQYEPDSDCDFIEFKRIIQQEWAARTA